MIHLFNQAPHQVVKKMVSGKVDLFGENTNTEVVRKVNLKTPFLVNNLEVPYMNHNQKPSTAFITPKFEETLPTLFYSEKKKIYVIPLHKDSRKMIRFLVR